MHVADICDDGDLRLDDLAEVADLAEVVHARFDDRDLMLARQLQHRLGHAEVGVEVALRLDGAKLPRQHARDHFLRRGLADAAGDLDKRDVGAVPVVDPQALEGEQRVIHRNIDLIREFILRLPLRAEKAACRAVLQRAFDIVMPVKAFALDGDEKLALPDRAAVGADRADYGVFAAAHQRAANGGGKFLYCDTLHVIFHVFLSRIHSRWSGTAPHSSCRRPPPPAARAKSASCRAAY